MKRSAILRTAWEGGHTAYRLPPTARRVYDQIRAELDGMFVLLAHRNFWKSGIAMTIADEECRRRPGETWAVILKTLDHATKVIRSVMQFMLRDCPEDLRPEPLRTELAWRYPNGSHLLFYGADHAQIETARGQGFDGAIFDEAGHQANLQENLHSIILPAIAKKGRGPVLLPSTPSRVPGHYFEQLCDLAKASGRYAFVPASQNPDVSDEWRAARAAECGGVESIDYRVEYECQFVADPYTTVLPNVTEARLKGTDGKPALSQHVEIPASPREWYCAMDIGGKHLTALLWGYYEPETDTVFIVREWTTRNSMGPEIARGIQITESGLWPDGLPAHFERWSDNNQLGFLYELHTGYKIYFKPTLKNEKISHLSSLRKLIDTGKLVVDSSCKLTLSTFRKAQWASGITSKGFAENNEIGHADLLDAALYLVRNVRRRPYPVIPLGVDVQAQPPGWGMALTPLRSEGMRRLAERFERAGEDAA